MKRIIGRIVIIGIFALSPCLSFALGFGDVKLYSYLEEPLDAEIELLDAENYEPERILVSLASESEFKRRGLSRAPILSELKFQVVNKNLNGTVSDAAATSKTTKATFIRITSIEAIKQPYLEFLMDLSWPNGRLVRGYTLLLDPAPPGIASLKERRASALQTKVEAINTRETQETNVQEIQQGNVQSQENSNNAPASNQEVRFNNATPPMIIVSTVPYEESHDEASQVSDATAVSSVTSDEQSVEASKTGEEAAPVSLSKISSHINQAMDPSVSTHVLFSFDKSHLNIAKYLVGFLLFAAIFWRVRLRKTFKTPFKRKINAPKNTDRKASVSVSMNEIYPEVVEPKHAEEEKTYQSPLDNEMSLKLDLARHYLAIKENVNALPLLEDVIARGAIWEKQAAEQLLSDALAKG